MPRRPAYERHVGPPGVAPFHFTPTISEVTGYECEQASDGPGRRQWWPGGEHITAWRRPNARPEAFLDLEYCVDWARTAERGKFDTIFLPDELYVWDRFESGVEYSSNVRGRQAG